MTSLRFAFRSFLKTPLFTTLAVGLIALAIAFNASLFSLLYVSLLRPLPYPESDRLVTIVEIENGRDTPVLAPANFDDVRREVESLEDATGYRYGELELSGLEPPERVTALFVLPGFFDFAAVPPLAGRLFDGDDHETASRRDDTLWSLGDVAVLDYEFWLRRFSGSRDVVGESLRLNDKNVLVVGVMPEGFDALWRETDVYVPWILPPGFWEARPPHILPVAARLAPGATIEEASAEVATLYARLADSYPETNAVLSARVEPLRAFLFGSASEAVLALQAGALLVLAVAAVNLAGLLSTRTRKRAAELGVRLALGASRSSIRRLLLVESALLVGVGGAVGLILAGNLLRLAELPVSLALPFEPRLSAGVVTASVVVLAATAFFLGLAPGWLASRQSLATSLRGHRNEAPAPGGGLTTVLAAVQVAGALGLASAGGALVSSLSALEREELGFESESVPLATFEVTLPDTRYPSEVEQRAFRRRALEELRSIPGVQSADTASHLPLTRVYLNLAIELVGETLPRGSLRAAPVFVSDGYLRTIGATILEGRGFEAADTKDAPWVVLVNQRMARDFWPGESVVGKRFRLDYPWMPPGPITVVGIVRDMKQEGLVQEVGPAFYILHEQFPQEWFYFALRTRLAPEGVIGEARARLRAIDPDLPMTDVQTMEDRIDGALAEYRTRTGLASLYAGSALLLAALGIYASLQSLIAQRSREIAIRLALGATPRDMLAWALRFGTRPLAAGVPLGLAAAWASGRVVQSLLFRVEPVDLAAMAETTLVVVAVALGATIVPALRASRSSPAAYASAE